MTQQQVQEPIITLTLPLSQVGTIIAGLGELPAKMSHATINDVQAQTQRHMQALEAEQNKGGQRTDGFDEKGQDNSDKGPDDE